MVSRGPGSLLEPSPLWAPSTTGLGGEESCSLVALGRCWCAACCLVFPVYYAFSGISCCLRFRLRGPSFGSLSCLTLLSSAKDVNCAGLSGWHNTPPNTHISPETRVMRCASTLSHPRPGFFLWKLSPKSPLNKHLSQEPWTQAPPPGNHIVATFINCVTPLPPRTTGLITNLRTFPRCYS